MPDRLTVTTRLSETEEMQLAALVGYKQTKSNVLREGLALVWNERGETALAILELDLPEAAERLRALMDAAGHEAKEE